MSRVGDHQQAEGTMMYDTQRDDNGVPVVRMLGFEPYEDVPMEVQSFSGSGKVQVRADGSVDVTVKKRVRHKVKVIKRTGHGRLVHTHSGKICMWVEVDAEQYMREGKSMWYTMMRESKELVDAMAGYELFMMED